METNKQKGLRLLDDMGHYFSQINALQDTLKCENVPGIPEMSFNHEELQKTILGYINKIQKLKNELVDLIQDTIDYTVMSKRGKFTDLILKYSRLEAECIITDGIIEGEKKDRMQELLIEMFKLIED